MIPEEDEEKIKTEYIETRRTRVSYEDSKNYLEEKQTGCLENKLSLKNSFNHKYKLDQDKIERILSPNLQAPRLNSKLKLKLVDKENTNFHVSDSQNKSLNSLELFKNSKDTLHTNMTNAKREVEGKNKTLHSSNVNNTYTCRNFNPEVNKNFIPIKSKLPPVILKKNTYNDLDKIFNAADSFKEDPDIKKKLDNIIQNIVEIKNVLNQKTKERVKITSAPTKISDRVKQSKLFSINFGKRDVSKIKQDTHLHFKYPKSALKDQQPVKVVEK